LRDMTRETEVLGNDLGEEVEPVLCSCCSRWHREESVLEKEIFKEEERHQEQRTGNDFHLKFLRRQRDNRREMIHSLQVTKGSKESKTEYCESQGTSDKVVRSRKSYLHLRTPYSATLFKESCYKNHG
jgi:hypothetical protein